MNKTSRLFYLLLISRIIRTCCPKGGCGASWKTMYFLSQTATIKHLQNHLMVSLF